MKARVPRRYITRTLEPVLQQAIEEFPAVVVTGPRQSGKTTMLRAVLGDRYGYASMETPDVRAAAEADPRGFLHAHPPPTILDEIQLAPSLLPYIKERIDADRGRSGQYALTGSQNLLLAEKVTESLAGRAAMLRLMPLSHREAEGEPQAVLAWQPGPHCSGSDARRYDGLWGAVVRGGYPELVADPGRSIGLWHSSYTQTYLERDVRSLRQVGDLSQFQAFLRALAARSAQLVNLSDISRDLGIALNTVKAWLGVLEATFQVHVVRPYFANLGKRLVKTPKIYFTDVGTLCHLSGLGDPQHAAQGPMGGALLETAVLSELVKTFVHRGLEPRIHFWRTAAGLEVDFLVECGPRLVPLEVKLSATPRPAMASAIRRLADDLGDSLLPGYVVHPGDIRLPLGSGVTALPFAEL